MAAALLVFITIIALAQSLLLLTIVSMLKNDDDNVTLVAERVVAYALRTHLHDVVDHIVRKDDAAATVKDASETIANNRDRWPA